VGDVSRQIPGKIFLDTPLLLCTVVHNSPTEKEQQVNTLEISAWNTRTSAWECVHIEQAADLEDLEDVELQADHFGGQPGATYLVELKDDGRTIDKAEVVAGPVETVSINDLAQELGVESADVMVLADQVTDDPALWSWKSAGLTEAGAQVVRDQLAWHRLDELAGEFQAAQRSLKQAKWAQVHAVHRARELGATWQEIAEAFGLNSREHARAIVR
jgi:hypothetical protein